MKLLTYCKYYLLLQGSVQGYVDRVGDTKLPVDWTTPYSSEQGNFIHASPQSKTKLHFNSLNLYDFILFQCAFFINLPLTHNFK